MKSGMRETKKITLSAIIVAFGVLFMTLGYFVEALDPTVAALLSLAMVFVFLEIGSPYTWLVYACTTLLGFLFYSASLVWVTYGLVFGLYPIIKAYVERLKKGAWIIVKLVYFNLSLALLTVVSEFVLGIPLIITEGFEGVMASVITVASYILMNLAFILYDICITKAVKIYYARLRPRIASLLK